MTFDKWLDKYFIFIFGGVIAFFGFLCALDRKKDAK